MLDAHQLLWTQIAAGVCLLMFAGMLFNLVRLRGRMRAAKSWDKVEGVITVSRVDQPAAHVSDDLNDATPVIRYRYRAGGQEFESDQIRIGGQPLTTRVLAGRQVARYPVGARVDVYIDPANAKNALLEPGQQGNLARPVRLHDRLRRHRRHSGGACDRRPRALYRQRRSAVRLSAAGPRPPRRGLQRGGICADAAAGQRQRAMADRRRHHHRV